MHRRLGGYDNAAFSLHAVQWLRGGPHRRLRVDEGYF